MCPSPSSPPSAAEHDARRGVAALRRRRNLFLLGPPAAFVALQGLLLWLHQVDASGETGSAVVWQSSVAVVALTAWIWASFWWAPAARCPRCRKRLAGPPGSAYGWLWPWMARPRCVECGFDPFAARASRDTP